MGKCECYGRSLMCVTVLMCMYMQQRCRLYVLLGWVAFNVAHQARHW